MFFFTMYLWHFVSSSNRLNERECTVSMVTIAAMGTEPCNLHCWYEHTLNPIWGWGFHRVYEMQRRSGKRGQRKTSRSRNISDPGNRSIQHVIAIVRLLVFQNKMRWEIHYWVRTSHSSWAIVGRQLLSDLPLKRLSTSQVLTTLLFIRKWIAAT